MNICVLYNPKAGSAVQIAALRTRLENLEGVCLIATNDADDLKRRVVEAQRGGFDRLAVAGGDGTIHAVVNAFSPDDRAPPLAILPLGTGNDLCRTLAIPLDLLAACDLLAVGEARRIDVIRVRGSSDAIAVNAVTGGFSGHVAQEVTHELKEFWGPLAYLRGALGTVANPPDYQLIVRFDDGPPEKIEALNIVVANGRTAAGGIAIAPHANPEDGLLDVVIVRSSDVIDLSIVTAQLLEGDYVRAEHVLHRRARRVEVESDPPLPISIDGERTEGTRFTFEVLPHALAVVVGPDYIPEPEPTIEVEDDDEPDDPRPRGIAQQFFGLLAAGLILIRGMPVVYGSAFLVASIAILGFTGLALASVRGEFREANEAAIWYLHRYESPLQDKAAITLSTLGNPLGSTLVAAAVILSLLARRRYLDAATLLACTAGCGLLVTVLKTAFALPRPALFPSLAPEEGYSFPSGHALMAVGLYGGLAALIVSRNPRIVWRWAAAVPLVLLALAICWSRVYLGVHYPMDVVAGILAGVCWVTGCLVARSYARGRMAMRNSAVG